MPDRTRWSFPDRLDDETVSRLEDAADAIQESVDGVDEHHRDEFMRWIGENVPAAAPIPDDRPATLEQDAFERGGYEIPIYLSEQLTASNGRWPEYAVSRSLAAALDDAKCNYTVRYGFAPLDPPSESPYSEDPSALTWFAEEADRPVAGHVNLLLTDDGGGVTGGNNCLAGARSLVPGSDPVRVGTGGEAANQYAALHEVGHALGVPGDADPSDDRTRTLGTAWVENGRWHKTLVCSTTEGGHNTCNEPIAPREGREEVFHNRFSDCAIRNFFTPDELAEEHDIRR